MKPHGIVRNQSGLYISGMARVIQENLLTIRDAARLLRVHSATVRRMIDAGLEATRIGKRIYTSREAIERFSKPVEAKPADKALAKKYQQARQRFGLKI